ncbi:hypothetical protein LAZ67_14002600 [Cordylochernes scorpioides]|uniref:ATP-dependent DNA helicase n=1 Tax=Cordylochernes scorpioides TaxID=51811 RepID=A0ABY6LBX8_9ARAC|nr:hypothetical protein LAZ67_14002600 [Cordylochernes scorpioides]
MAPARAVGKIVIPLASTGIAATLLSGGQTVHSRFKLPIPLLENSVAAISANSSEAELIRRSSLIIWDEAPMAHYRALEIVDRLLKDIMHCDLAFGGKVVVLGGDFRQVLPVVPRASRAEIVAACIKQSKLWPLFVILRLTQNMRAGIDAQSFSQWLLKVGDGDLPTDQQGLISLPESCIFHGVDLVQEIFGSSYGDITALSKSVILTPKNTDSLEINEKVLDRLPNRSQCFLSVDSVECENVEEQNNYPTEFLNSLTPTGMPPHRLNLKIGAIVMLLRNLNPKQGLCNGTRMVIQRMRSHVLEAQILTGTKVGQTVLVPKISLAPSDTNLPFILKRRQFPLRAVGKIVIPLASTGIAATLLSGGQTVHSRFKLPIPLLENSVAAISANSSEAELIRRSSLIIWDEAPMAHYRALEIVDRLLKDIMHCDLAFGGKVVVLGGDFRQVLPVVPRASRAEIVAACIKQSKLWPLFVILRLTQNMRAGIDAQSFSQWLLKVGDGDLPTDQQGLISLPESCIFHGVDLVQEIFGSSYGDITALSQSVILTPKNTDSLEINEKVLDRLPNRRMPPHRLNLKIGAIVMLLRNLNPKQGLCNGTRMVIQRMRSHVLEAQILTGTKVGQTVLVPKISLAPSDTNLPFILKRRQFPLRLAFAMTINKAQGQTFARALSMVNLDWFSAWCVLHIQFLKSDFTKESKPECEAEFDIGKCEDGDDGFSIYYKKASRSCVMLPTGKCAKGENRFKSLDDCNRACKNFN